MCSIIGTFDLDQIRPLYELNSYRGKYSHSISVYNNNTKRMALVKRSLDELPEYDIDLLRKHYSGDEMYYIIHSQAPTGDDPGMSTVHPAAYWDPYDADMQGSYLWHNGILKHKTIEALKVHKPDSNWDTELLLHYILSGGNLSHIDGSFACLMFNKNKVFCFRNEIAPLFIDKTLNISSTVFEGAYTVLPNKMYSINFDNRDLVLESTFLTKNSPYVL